MYINVYVRICVNIYYMNIYIFVCVNISIYTYTYIYIYICTKDTYSNDIAGQGARGPVPLFGGDDLTRCEVLWCQMIWSSFRCPASIQALGWLFATFSIYINVCYINKKFLLKQCLDELFWGLSRIEISCGTNIRSNLTRLSLVRFWFDLR